jgi:hypothetical protein
LYLFSIETSFALKNSNLVFFIDSLFFLKKYKDKNYIMLKKIFDKYFVEKRLPSKNKHNTLLESI